MQRLLVEQRGLLLLVAAGSLLLVATTIGAAVIDDVPVRTQAARVAANGARPTAVAPVRRAPRVVIRRTAAGDGRTRAALERAVADETDPAKRRALRFQIATLDEAVGGAGEPMALTVLPTRDLVFVCERLGPREQACVSILRKLGRAEGLAVTVVYLGPEEFGAWFEKNRALLGRVDAVPDPDGRFNAAHGLTGNCAVLGLHADGRAAFVLTGTCDRAQLDAQLARLR